VGPSLLIKKLTFFGLKDGIPLILKFQFFLSAGKQGKSVKTKLADYEAFQIFE